MIRTSSRSPGIFFAALVLTVARGLAASPTRRPQDLRATIKTDAIGAQTLESSTDLVRVRVSILDKHGNFASGLTQRDFRVLDDGVERPVLFFAPMESPAHVLVMIETSPAVYLIHDQHLVAAYALVQGLDSADKVALVTYSDKPRKALGFTTNKSSLLGALNSLEYTIGMGELNFYDSLSAVLDNFPPAEGKAAIVLLTTGIDSSPTSHWAPLVDKLRGTDVVIFSVALGGVLRGENVKARKKKHARQTDATAVQTSDSPDQLTGFARADRALKLLAQITGGRAFFPQSDKEFVPIYREIAASLRHQYVLGIAPAHDGKFHSLAVAIVPGGAKSAKRAEKAAYRTFAREGYIAPSN